MTSETPCTHARLVRLLAHPVSCPIRLEKKKPASAITASKLSTVHFSLFHQFHAAHNKGGKGRFNFWPPSSPSLTRQPYPCTHFLPRSVMDNVACLVWRGEQKKKSYGDRKKITTPHVKKTKNTSWFFFNPCVQLRSEDPLF